MTPQSLPVLSRGKHRSPRRGACFMEFASLLAGERWSDHPRCTHPVLAALARAVNDVTSEQSRHELAPLVPDVIGTTRDAPAVAAALVELVCREALRHVDDSRRFVLSVGLVSAETLRARLAPDLTGPDDGPDPLAWGERRTAAEHMASFRVSARHYQRRGAIGVIEYAVATMASPPTTCRDADLRALLSRAIERYHVLVPEAASPSVGDGSWRVACATVGVAVASPAAGRAE